MAFMLRDSDDITAYTRDELIRHIDWLKMHLTSPAIMDSGTNYRAIFWFKDAAHEPMRHIWVIKTILDEYGYWIAAKPWRNKKGRPF